jgi:hypothetical protein
MTVFLLFSFNAKEQKQKQKQKQTPLLQASVFLLVGFKLRYRH